jgi:phosphoribosylamine--glycine ligase
LTSKGYPLSYETGKIIKIKDDSDCLIFYAGMKKKNRDFFTNGGRVLNIVAHGSSVQEARRLVYKCAESIYFSNKYYRSDIGEIY